MLAIDTLYIDVAALAVPLGVVLAVLLKSALAEPALRELLISLFLFVTAPVSANLMAQAGCTFGRVRTRRHPTTCRKSEAENRIRSKDLTG